MRASLALLVAGLASATNTTSAPGTSAPGTTPAAGGNGTAPAMPIMPATTPAAAAATTPAAAAATTPAASSTATTPAAAASSATTPAAAASSTATTTPAAAASSTATTAAAAAGNDTNTTGEPEIKSVGIKMEVKAKVDDTVTSDCKKSAAYINVVTMSGTMVLCNEVKAAFGGVCPGFCADGKIAKGGSCLGRDAVLSTGFEASAAYDKATMMMKCGRRLDSRGRNLAEVDTTVTDTPWIKYKETPATKAAAKTLETKLDDPNTDFKAALSTQITAVQSDLDQGKLPAGYPKMVSASGVETAADVSKVSVGVNVSALVDVSKVEVTATKVKYDSSTTSGAATVAVSGFALLGAALLF